MNVAEGPARTCHSDDKACQSHPQSQRPRTDVAPALRCWPQKPGAVGGLASLTLQLLKTGQGSDPNATWRGPVTRLAGHRAQDSGSNGLSAGPSASPWVPQSASPHLGPSSDTSRQRSLTRRQADRHLGPTVQRESSLQWTHP